MRQPETRRGPLGTVTPDGLFSAIEFECLGSCTTAPVMQVNGEFYENLDVRKTESIIDELRKQPNINDRISHQLRFPHSDVKIVVIFGGCHGRARDIDAGSNAK